MRTICIRNLSLLMLLTFGLGPVNRGFGQTEVNLLNQGRNFDFSTAAFTRPMTVGTALPSTCQVGQLFFNSAAAAGVNVYACTATNTWSLEGGNGGGGGSSSGGASSASQLTDFSTTLSSGTLTIGSTCSASTPCNVRVGNMVYSVKNSATVSATGSTSGLIFIYVDSAGNLTAGSTVALTCTGCVYVPGITAFPAGSVPLFNWTVTSGNLAAGSAVDFRAFLSTKALAAGLGVLISENSGVSTIAIDPSVASTYVATAPATSGASCSIGQFSVDTNYYYFCIAANNWKRIAWGSSF